MCRTALSSSCLVRRNADGWVSPCLWVKSPERLPDFLFTRPWLLVYLFVQCRNDRKGQKPAPLLEGVFQHETFCRLLSTVGDGNFLDESGAGVREGVRL